MAGQSLIEILFKSKYDGSGTNNAKDSLKEIDNAAGIAAGGIAAVGAALGLAGAVKFGQTVYEFAQLSAQAGRVEQSFRRMSAGAGQSADEVLAALKKASAGTIADSQLELQANRARILGVANTTQQLTQLLEIARVRGAAVGRSTAEAFDDLVTGIGRASPLILDNLGIVTGGQKTFDAYAASIGKTADQLTDIEKKQALFNKVVQDSQGMLRSQGGAANDAATNFERLGAAIQNAKEQGSKGNVGFISSLAGFGADIISKILSDSQKLQNNEAAANAAADIRNLSMALTDLKEKRDLLLQNQKQGIGIDENQLSALNGAIDRTSQALSRASGEANSTANSTNGLADALNRSEGAMDAAAEAASRAAIHTKLFGDSAIDAKGKVDALTGSVLTLAGALPGLQAHINAQLDAAARARDSAVSSLASKAAGTSTDQDTRLKLYRDGVSQIDDQWAKLNAEVRDGSITQDEYALKAAQLGINAGNAFDDITTAQREAESSAKRWASSVENEVKKAYDHLKSTVAGVIQGAQSLSDIGVDPSKILRDPKETDPKKQIPLLPREDEINENARRLADIAVNGFKGQDWLGKFKEQVPDIWKALEESGDPRATAARLLERFQDGLEPELLDKEKAKERVRKLLLGEAKTNELVDEITQEMADEMGQATPSDLKSKVKEALTGKSDEKTKIEVDTSGISPAIQTAFAAPDISVSGGGGGGAAGKAFNDKILSSVANTGTRVVDAVDGELRAPASLERLGTAGSIGGNAYGTQFLSGAINNIAQPFLDAVTGIVTKNVIANLNTQNQLQGGNP